jgi:hypothetical protein
MWPTTIQVVMPTPLVPHRVFYSRTRQANILPTLFAEWHSILSKSTTWLARSSEPDHPYWYGERTNVGWLALAAYEKGWLPLQEPTVPRRGKRAGRSDLWVYASRGPNTRVYDFEAKDAWLNVDSPKNPQTFYRRDYIKKNLKKALKQLKKPQGYAGHSGVGLVFVRLYGNKKSTKSDLMLDTVRFIKAATSTRVLKKAGADFIALYLAPYSYIKTVAPSYGPHLGIAVLGKRAW